MKSLIIYKSKWGSTQEYAEYIQKNIANSDIFTIDSLKTESLKNYDIVIIGSRTFMGNIDALSFLTRHWNILRDKKVYLFAVGMINPENKESVASYEKIPEEIRKNIQYLKVPGRIVMQKLNFLEKTIANARKGITSDKVDMKLIEPVIEWANKFTD